MMEGFGLLLVVTLCSCSFGNVLSFKGEVNEEKPLNAYDRTLYEDCNDVQSAGYSESGVYRLYVNERAVLLPCEFRDDGNAYTVFLRRVSNETSFNRFWADYKKGFGNPKKNFWAGLETIHGLTKKDKKTLNYLLEDWKGTVQNLNYSDCNVEDEDGNYTIHYVRYHGTLKYDDLRYHNNMPFTTPDTGVCAEMAQCGWWFHNCSLTLPTGYFYNNAKYDPPGPLYDGIFYRDWLGFDYSMKTVSMALF